MNEGTGDETEGDRIALVAAINTSTADRPVLEKVFGKGNVWDTDELTRDFEVLQFMAPFCIVRRRSSGVRGTVTFQHRPRFYWDFEPE